MEPFSSPAMSPHRVRCPVQAPRRTATQATSPHGSDAESGAGALAGDGSITVNFGTHAVTGSLTGMQAINTTTNQVSIWNNVAISATQISNQFSGTTSVTTTPGTEFSLLLRSPSIDRRVGR